MYYVDTSYMAKVDSGRDFKGDSKRPVLQLMPPEHWFHQIRLKGRSAGREYQEEIRRQFWGPMYGTEFVKLLGNGREKWSVEVNFYFRDDVSKLDVDNLLKPVLDAYSGSIWKDDSQITSVRVAKYHNAPVDGYSISADAVEGY